MHSDKMFNAIFLENRAFMSSFILCFAACYSTLELIELLLANHGPTMWVLSIVQQCVKTVRSFFEYLLVYRPKNPETLYLKNSNPVYIG